MKYGIRTPSITKSVKAKTTGNLTRSIKKATVPGYGKKGIGYLKDPGRSVKNAVYHRSTVGVRDITKTGSAKRSEVTKSESYKAYIPSGSYISSSYVSRAADSENTEMYMDIPVSKLERIRQVYQTANSESSKEEILSQFTPKERKAFVAWNAEISSEENAEKATQLKRKVFLMVYVLIYCLTIGLIVVTIQGIFRFFEAAQALQLILGATGLIACFIVLCVIRSRLTRL